jgi:glycerol kinase
VGLTRGVNKNHIIRATLESIAYQVSDVLEAMDADMGFPITSLKVDGGASANNVLMQFQADILQCDVHRPKCVETTALGAAYLAGLAVGYWDSPQQTAQNWVVERSFSPSITAEERLEKVAGWKRAVGRSFNWAKD